MSRGRFTLRGGAEFGDQMGAALSRYGQRRAGWVGGRRSSILSGATRDWLLERMTRDFTLRGLVAELAGRGVKVDYVQVWRFAHAEGLSFKKKRAARRTAPSRDRPASGAVEEIPGPA